MARELTAASSADTPRTAARWPVSLLLSIAVLVVAIVLGIAGPGAFDLDPTAQLLRLRNHAPSDAHLLGTDHLGRDVLARLIAGLGMSLAVAAMALVIAVAAGVLPALVAATVGGPIETMLVWLVDLLRAMPGVLLALVLAAVLGSGVMPLSLAVGLTFAPTFALVTRAAYLHERGMPYIEALQGLGAGALRVSFLPRAAQHRRSARDASGDHPAALHRHGIGDELSWSRRLARHDYLGPHDRPGLAVL